MPLGSPLAHSLEVSGRFATESLNNPHNNHGLPTAFITVFASTDPRGLLYKGHTHNLCNWSNQHPELLWPYGKGRCCYLLPCPHRRLLCCWKPRLPALSSTAHISAPQSCSCFYMRSHFRSQLQDYFCAPDLSPEVTLHMPILPDSSLWLLCVSGARTITTVGKPASWFKINRYHYNSFYASLIVTTKKNI